MGMRRVAPTRASISARETGRTVRSIDRQDLNCWVAAVALGCGLRGASRQVEQAAEGFVGLDCRDLMGGRTPSHHVFHLPLKPRSTGSLAAANRGKGRHHRSRPILSRWLPEKDAANARVKVRRPADGKCLDVEGGFLKPGGVIGDEDERARRISRPSANPPPETMRMGIGKIATSPKSR